MLLAVTGGVPFLGRAELLFDALGAMRRRQVDLQSKRHLVVTNGAVHGLSFCRNAIPTDSLVPPLSKPGSLPLEGQWILQAHASTRVMGESFRTGRNHS